MISQYRKLESLAVRKAGWQVNVQDGLAWESHEALTRAGLRSPAAYLICIEIEIGLFYVSEQASLSFSPAGPSGRR